MKKDLIISILKFVVKYFLPAFLGWLEGSTGTVQDTLTSML